MSDIGAAATFTGLVDLAAEGLGGRALSTSDDFFAGMENLLKPGRAVFVPGKFTERGKWMDGWESRRKRRPGFDHCVIALGVQGRVLGFDIDTQHFVGNHPPYASVDGCFVAPGPSADALAHATWRELLPQAPLRPDAQNLFAAQPGEPVSHVRLNIFPDGGVARLRVFGEVSPFLAEREIDTETAGRVAPDWVDLAALKNGALPLACSDARFGPMHHLLAPGRAQDMGGGWETRRKREPGHDWILVRLAARGRPRLVEIDTRHFKGNYPDRCAIDAIDAIDGMRARITELIESDAYRRLLPEVELAADTRHFYADLEELGAATHLRLRIFPDGGVSRLRVWGTREP